MCNTRGPPVTDRYKIQREWLWLERIRFSVLKTCLN